MYSIGWPRIHKYDYDRGHGIEDERSIEDVAYLLGLEHVLYRQLGSNLFFTPI
eukprot:COSAG01_NODE_4344_length_5117_cov_29.590674_1_plen_52_part_10